MKPASRLVAVSAAVVLLSGCGTVCNFVGGIFHPDVEPRIYGGVQRDMEVLQALGTPGLYSLSQSNPSSGSQAGILWLFGLIAADPLLSLAGDTLTLPITLYLDDKRHQADARDQAGRAASALDGGRIAGEAFSAAMPCRETIEVGECRAGAAFSASLGTPFIPTAYLPGPPQADFDSSYPPKVIAPELRSVHPLDGEPASGHDPIERTLYEPTPSADDAAVTLPGQDNR